MALPSFDNGWREGQSVKPRILVLEIKDKDRPDDKALGWVLVEREETYRRDPRDGTIYEASIRLSYQRITAKFSHRDGGKGRFDGSYSRNFNAVSLTSTSMSKGAVFLDLPGLDGQRIGTYLMNEIVQWVQQWPEATVNGIELLAGQGHGDNKARRNWFYEQFGLVFDYTDPEHREGRSRPMLAGALVKVETWKQNITEHRMLDYLAAVLYAEERATSELQARDRACAQLIAEQRRAEARPVRWALRQLYYRYANTVLGVAVLTMLIGMALLRIRG
jgi:GNAT superfamily N-acetyltransferase